MDKQLNNKIMNEKNEKMTEQDKEMFERLVNSHFSLFRRLNQSNQKPGLAVFLNQPITIKSFVTIIIHIKFIG